jgi:hypothetical protein
MARSSSWRCAVRIMFPALRRVKRLVVSVSHSARIFGRVRTNGPARLRSTLGEEIACVWVHATARGLPHRSEPGPQDFRSSLLGRWDSGGLGVPDGPLF